MPSLLSSPECSRIFFPAMRTWGMVQRPSRTGIATHGFRKCPHPYLRPVPSPCSYRPIFDGVTPFGCMAWKRPVKWTVGSMTSSWVIRTRIPIPLSSVPFLPPWHANTKLSSSPCITHYRRSIDFHCRCSTKLTRSSALWGRIGKTH